MSQQVSTLEARLESHVTALQQSQAEAQTREQQERTSHAASVDQRVEQARESMRAEVQRVESTHSALHERHTAALSELSASMQALQAAVERHDAYEGQLTLLRGELDKLASVQLSQEEAVHRNEATLSTLSSLPLAAMPSQLSTLSDSVGKLSAEVESMREKGALEKAATSAILSNLSTARDSLSKQLAAHVATFESSNGSLAARVGKVEESLRALPPHDPTLAPRIKDCYLQLDRLTQEMEMTRQSANSKKPTTVLNAKPAVNTEAEEKSERLHTARKCIASNSMHRFAHLFLAFSCAMCAACARFVWQSAPWMLASPRATPTTPLCMSA